MEQIELVLHPVRMRMILAIATRVLTTQQLANLLPDVAQTTLYRHINLLLEGGILTVVRESKVRGTVERELALVKGAGRIDMETSTNTPPAAAGTVIHGVRCRAAGGFQAGPVSAAQRYAACDLYAAARISNAARASSAQ